MSLQHAVIFLAYSSSPLCSLCKLSVLGAKTILKCQLLKANPNNLIIRLWDMYSCNRRLRLVGNQPTRPGNRPSHPARPSNRPSHPARPSKRPSHPARPGNRPSHPARPSNRPSHPTRPSNRPYHPALPTNRPPHLPHPAVGKCRLNPPPTILLQPSFSAIRGNI